MAGIQGTGVGSLRFTIAAAIAAIAVAAILIMLRSPEETPDVNEAEFREALQPFRVETIGGVILAKSDTVLTLEVTSIMGKEVPYAFRVRTIRVSPETRMVRFTEKSRVQVEEALAAHQAAGGGGPPPSPYRTEAVSLEDLAVGDSVVVQGKPGTDMVYHKVIDAAHIAQRK